MASVWDNLSLEQILKSFPPRVTTEALDLCALRQVQKLRCVDNYLEGQVTEKGRRYATAIVMDEESDTLHMSCDCGGMRDSPCVHAIAVLIAQASRDTPIPLELPTATAAQAQPIQAGLSPFLTVTPQDISADWKRRLQNLTVKDMRDICVAWGTKVKGSLREQVTDGLIEMVMRPGALAQVVERLQPDTRRALDVLCASAHPSPNFNLEQISPYLDAVLASSGSKPRPFEACLEDLARLGLVRPDYTPMYPVPLQVVAQLPPDPTLFKILEGEPKRITPAKPFQFTRLTLRLLLMAQNKLLSCAPPARIVTKNGWVMRAEADQDSFEREILPETGYLADNLRTSLATTLDKPPELIDLAARMLDSSSMWAPRAPEKIHNQMHAWMELTPQEQSRRLFALFSSFPTQMELDLARLTGFAPIHNARSNPNYKDFLKMLGTARLRLVRLLMLAPGGQWLEIESILHMLHALQPGWWMEFNSRQKDTYNQQIWGRTPVWASAGRKRIDPLVYEDWRKAYGQFYLTILTRSMLWLGLVDVAWREDQPLAVRLAEFGEFLLNRRPDFALPAPQAGQHALFQHSDGTFELDLDLATPDLISLLMLIAMPVTDKVKTGSAIPRRLSYRISESGLGTAFEAGWTVEQIITRLQFATSNPLSDGLVQRLQAIWDHFGRLQIYEDMSLIEFADDYCLPELLAGTSLSQILLYTFSPRLIAVRPEAVDKFVADLQAKGYTPRLEGGSRA